MKCEAIKDIYQNSLDLNSQIEQKKAQIFFKLKNRKKNPSQTRGLVRNLLKVHALKEKI